MASVRATFKQQALATLVATWATSRAWVSLVRWWSSGKTNTWVLPASRRNAVAWRMRSRSRSKQVRQGSGATGRDRWPAPLARVAPGANRSDSIASRCWRSSPASGPGNSAEERLSAWAKVMPDPGWPAIVDAQRRFLSLSPSTPSCSPSTPSCCTQPVCPKAVTARRESLRTLYRRTGPAHLSGPAKRSVPGGRADRDRTVDEGARHRVARGRGPRRGPGRHRGGTGRGRENTLADRSEGPPGGCACGQGGLRRGGSAHRRPSGRLRDLLIHHLPAVGPALIRS